MKVDLEKLNNFYFWTFSSCYGILGVIAKKQKLGFGGVLATVTPASPLLPPHRRAPFCRAFVAILCVAKLWRTPAPSSSSPLPLKARRRPPSSSSSSSRSRRAPLPSRPNSPPPSRLRLIPLGRTFASSLRCSLTHSSYLLVPIAVEACCRCRVQSCRHAPLHRGELPPASLRLNQVPFRSLGELLNLLRPSISPLLPLFHRNARLAAVPPECAPRRRQARAHVARCSRPCPPPPVVHPHLPVRLPCSPNPLVHLFAVAVPSPAMASAWAGARTCKNRNSKKSRGLSAKS